MLLQQHHGSKCTNLENLASILTPSPTSLKWDGVFTVVTATFMFKPNKTDCLMMSKTPEGEKIPIIVTHIEYLIDVQVPVDKDSKEFICTLKQISVELDICPSFKLIERRNGHGYHPPQDFVRILFNKTKDRKIMLTHLNEKFKFKIYSDPSSHLERTLKRYYHINMCSWNKATKFERKKSKEIKYDYVYVVDVRDIVELESYHDFNVYRLLFWDIETYSSGWREGKFPSASIEKDEIFNISMTCYTKGEETISIILTTRPQSNDKDYLTVELKTEQQLLKAFIIIMHKLRPDFKVGFNCSTFDWPYLISRCERYKLLIPLYEHCSSYNHFMYTRSSSYNKLKTIKEWSIRPFKMKITPDLSTSGITLKVNDSISIDLMVALRKAYPKDTKYSLKHFLDKFGLSGKDDMAYNKMFEIYESGNRDDMRKVSHYCHIDAKRLMELMQATNYLNECRELSSLSGTPIRDSIYYANSMKVENLILINAEEKGILFRQSRRTVAKTPYPGAYVYDPKIGCYRPCSVKELKSLISTNQLDDAKGPMSCLDFMSLYPSLMMALNISLEQLITRIKDFDPSRLNKVKICLNQKEQYVYFMDHNTIDGVRLKPNRDTPNMGLFPSILLNLLRTRRDLKKKMKPYAEQIEKLSLMQSEGDSKVKDKLCEARLIYDMIDAKQKALKVFMNTFYGSLGSPNSIFYDARIAASITCSGKTELKFVERRLLNPDFCTINGLRGACKIYYGDTDSIYFSIPSVHFRDIHLRYVEDKDDVKYNTALVEKTFEIIKIINSKVNQSLRDKTGTIFLKMAYEEVLWPFVLMSKKKYAGIPHEETINFFPTDNRGYFIRGMQAIRRDCSTILKTLTYEILKEGLDITVHTPIEDITIRKVKELFHRDWKVKDFEKSGMYKPASSNQQMAVFHNRMKSRDDHACPPPKPGERFPYVIALTPSSKDVGCVPYNCGGECSHDIRGSKKKMSIGERMEYLSYAIDKGLQIDLNYYTLSGIVSEFAPFLSNIYPETTEAKAFLTNLCKGNGLGVDCKGKRLKELFKSANDKFKNLLYIYISEKFIFNHSTIDLITSVITEYRGKENLYTFLETSITKKLKTNKYAINKLKQFTEKFTMSLTPYEKKLLTSSDYNPIRESILYKYFLKRENYFNKCIEDRDKAISILKKQELELSIFINIDLSQFIKFIANMIMVKGDRLKHELLQSNC